MTTENNFFYAENEHLAYALQQLLKVDKNEVAEAFVELFQPETAKKHDPLKPFSSSEEEIANFNEIMLNAIEERYKNSTEQLAQRLKEIMVFIQPQHIEHFHRFVKELENTLQIGSLQLEKEPTEVDNLLEILKQYQHYLKLKNKRKPSAKTKNSLQATNQLIGSVERIEDENEKLNELDFQFKKLKQNPQFKKAFAEDSFLIKWAKKLKRLFLKKFDKDKALKGQGENQSRSDFVAKEINRVVTRRNTI